MLSGRVAFNFQFKTIRHNEKLNRNGHSLLQLIISNVITYSSGGFIFGMIAYESIDGFSTFSLNGIVHLAIIFSAIQLANWNM